MSRIRIAPDTLVDRIISGSPKSLCDFRSVSDFLSKVRRTYTEYKLDSKFLEKVMSRFDDAEMLVLEYYFRNQDEDSEKLLSNILVDINDSGIRFSKYINWCYSIGMSEKNQIRIRLEFFDPDWLNSSGFRTKTKAIRSYCKIINKV